MELTCEHCKAKLNIPDERIPKDRAIQLTCPKCRGKMTLGGKQAAAKAPPHNPAPASAGGSSQGSKDAAYTYEDYSSDEALVFYEEGTKLALVMADYPGYAERIQKSLKQLGYECISTPNTTYAIGKWRFHHFDLLVLSDGFGGQPVENALIPHLRSSNTVTDKCVLLQVGERFVAQTFQKSRKVASERLKILRKRPGSRES
jgi:hypothetical protein